MTQNMRTANTRFQCANTQRPDRSACTTNSPTRTRIRSLRILNCLKSVSATWNKTAAVITSTTWESAAETAIRLRVRRRRARDGLEGESVCAPGWLGAAVFASQDGLKRPFRRRGGQERSYCGDR